jgi:hypothetical protein
VGDELILAGRGQTDRQAGITKLMVAFSSFEKQIDTDLPKIPFFHVKKYNKSTAFK